MEEKGGVDKALFFDVIVSHYSDSNIFVYSLIHKSFQGHAHWYIAGRYFLHTELKSTVARDFNNSGVLTPFRYTSGCFNACWRA